MVNLPDPVDDVCGLGDESRPLPFEHRTHGTRVVEHRHAGGELGYTEPDVAQLPDLPRGAQQVRGVGALAGPRVDARGVQHPVLVVVP